MMPAPLPPVLILLAYAVVNGSIFLLYANDKRMARAAAWRTPESILLLSAFFGPFGAYGAMKLLRHKTQKLKFYLVPVFLLVHAGLITGAILW
jgi:uncharacterized membrane protein YsdA (DUF1294 family)